MFIGLFQKNVTYLILISFFHLSCFQTLLAMWGDTDDIVSSHRAPSPQIAIPIQEEPSLLTLLQDDPQVVEDLKAFVQTLPQSTRKELGSLAELQEYVDTLGPKGTHIKWAISIINGLAQAAGVAVLFAGAPAVSGMLNIPLPADPTAIEPALAGCSAVAGVFTLPDTILGSETLIEGCRMALTKREGDEYNRLIEYYKKKGASHIVIRGVVDGTGTTFFVVMTAKAFLDALSSGVSPIALPILFILGSEVLLHQTTTSAQTVDGMFLRGQRLAQDRRATPDQRIAREKLDTPVMDALRKALKERDEARDYMQKIRALRNLLKDALEQLNHVKSQLPAADASLADQLLEERLTLKDLEMLSELYLIKQFNPEGKYRPAKVSRRWYEYIPLLDRIFGRYPKLYKAVYTPFALFAAVGSYISYYGFTWTFTGIIGSAAANPLGGITAALFTLYFMDRMGQSAATAASGFAGYNTAMDKQKVDQTYTGSTSRWARYGRATLDFVIWGFAGYKTLYKTGASAVGAGNLMGNTDESHQKQMPGIVSLAASNGSDDHMRSGPVVQEAINRALEQIKGSGAQAFVDYLARLQEGLADIDNERIVELSKEFEAFEGFVAKMLQNFKDLQASSSQSAGAAQEAIATDTPINKPMAKDIGAQKDGSGSGSPDSSDGSAESQPGLRSDTSDATEPLLIDSRRSSPDSDTPAQQRKDSPPKATGPQEIEMVPLVERRLPDQAPPPPSVAQSAATVAEVVSVPPARVPPKKGSGLRAWISDKFQQYVGRFSPFSKDYPDTDQLPQTSSASFSKGDRELMPLPPQRRLPPQTKRRLEAASVDVSVADQLRRPLLADQ